LSHTSSPFCSGYFGDGSLKNYLPGLASNCYPAHLILLSSQDYRHEPPMPTSGDFFYFILFYYSYVHTRLGCFVGVCPTPSLTTHSGDSLMSWNSEQMTPRSNLLRVFLGILIHVSKISHQYLDSLKKFKGNFGTSNTKFTLN
jgi:hypothetical protein